MSARPSVALERYKYKISDITLTADGFEEPIVVSNKFVKSICIIHNYENNVSPKMQITFEANKEDYEDIVLNMNTLFATFTIYKNHLGEISQSVDIEKDSVEQDHVWKEFQLKAVNEDNISTQNANKLMNDDEYADQSLDNSQKTVSITLLLYDDKKITDYRKSKYFIIKGGKNDVLYNFFKDRGLKNILMSPTDNKLGIYKIPYGHLGENIRLLNKYYGIYDTPYLFYMDFDTIYLIEKGKVGSTLKPNEFKAVSIYLEKESSSTYIDTGCYIDNDNNMYIFNTSNFEISDKDSSIDYAMGGNIRTVIAGTGEIKNDKIGDYDVERTVVVDTPKHHSQLIYSIKEQKRNVVLQFTNIDLDVFTPNKKYIILPDETFYDAKYDLKGDYRMLNSMIMLRRTNENELNSSIQIYLSKIPKKGTNENR